MDLSLDFDAHGEDFLDSNIVTCAGKVYLTRKVL